MSKGATSVGVAIAAVAASGLWHFADQLRGRAADAPADGNDFALFKHADGQLHCLDRELRHPCVRELRGYIDDKSSNETKATALQCVRDVLGSSTDYWELKNMTHLLLDLDTVEHVFDQGARDGEFVMAGIDFAKKLMAHEECMDDFDEKSELECRCVPLFAKIAILKYKNAGMVEEAKSLFQQVTSMPWEGKVRSYAPGEAVRWDSYQHTPQIWVKGLRSMKVWPRETWGDLPICKRLEDNYETILEETNRALADEAASGFEDAYRFLYDKGEWSQVVLYNARKFTEECETVFPKTCALLKQWLPSKPGLPWTSDQNEQVLVLKMKVGTDVETHSGPSNNILNIHIGLAGLKGAKLIIANETHDWQEGKVIAWDGSYDHRVHCLDCTEDRIIMMVRYMHPDMAPEHYKGNKRTHFEDVPEHMQ